MWAWMSADDWEHELEQERIEQERITAIQEYNRSKQSSALGEDYVDTTPIPVKEAEPVFQSAKKTVVKTKKQIKRRVKQN
jgi:hypothetical protein